MRHERYTVYPETVHGPHAERGIAPGDWRDPDVSIDLRGCHINVQDPSRSDSPIIIQRPNGEIVDLAELVRKHPGRVIATELVLRDEQMHNQATG